METVVTTSRALVNMCDLPLVVLGYCVRSGDMVCEEDGVSSLLEDRRGYYHMGVVFGYEFVDSCLQSL